MWAEILQYLLEDHGVKQGLGPLALLAGGTVLSGLLTSRSAGKAADATEAAADKTAAVSREIYYDTKKRLGKYETAGSRATDALMYELGLRPNRPTWGRKVTPAEIEVIPGKAGSGGSSGGGTLADILNGLNGVQSGGGTANRYRVDGKIFDTRKEANAYAKKIGTTSGGFKYGGYEMSPMAEYLMKEGVSNIEGGAAARGGLFSGGTAEALEDHRYDVVSSDVDRYLSWLSGQQNAGLSAASGISTAGQGYAGTVGSAYTSAGSAQAGAHMAQGQAIQSTIGDLAGIYGYMQNPMTAYTASSMPSGF